MILLILTLMILLPVLAGTYAIVVSMNRWSQVRGEHLRALKASNDHQNALRAIQVAKAWDQATQPDTTPQLTKPKQPDPVITADDIIEPITHDDVIKSGYDPTVVKRYVEQEKRGRRTA